MRIPLNEMTVKSEKVLYRLKSYLDQISHWERFDRSQLFHVYVNSEKDFCAFESRSHNLNFTSTDHKISEIIYSQYELADITYEELKAYVASL